MTQIDEIIPAEIKNDQFYELIRRLSERESLSNVLEIGSSSGAGSTEAFVHGLSLNKNHPKLFCLEVSKTRYQALKTRYQDQSLVHVYHASSIPIEKFMSPAEVEKFYSANQTNLNQYPLDQVLGWLEQDIAYVRDSSSITNGIETIKRENAIDWFDLVLIDGSAFTGMAELAEVIGAEHILLDDINDIKCLDAYRHLKLDPSYRLVCEDWSLRNGFAYFRRTSKMKKESVPVTVSAPEQLPLHIFTIVLNGFPFIRHHIEVFRRLKGLWHWHIVEGVAELLHDTAWSVAQGGRIDANVHRQGRSRDGTSEYLDQLAAAFPDNVSIYRKPLGQFWSGKLEMVNAPLAAIDQTCLLFQVDSDELWSVSQIEVLRDLFQKQREKTAAYFFCDYYVGENLHITSRNTYGNNSSYEWLRAWRFEPGARWAAHEPPRLCRQLSPGGPLVDLSQIDPILHEQTESAGLVFQHYAYTTPEQLDFKRSYYGYQSAIEDWQRLQSNDRFPCRLSDYFAWVKDGAIVERADLSAAHILARKAVDGSWMFWPYGAELQAVEGEPSLDVPAAVPELPGESLLSDSAFQPRTILIVRPDSIGDLVVMSSILRHLDQRFPASRIILVCQAHIAPLFEHCPHIDSVFSFDKNMLKESEPYQIQITTALQKLRPDLAINGIVSPDAVSHLLTLASGSQVTVGLVGDLCNIEERVQQSAESQYTFLLPSPVQTSEATNHRILLESFGVTPAELTPEVWFGSSEEAFIEKFLSDNGLVPERTVTVFASAQFSQKNYADLGVALRRFCEANSFSLLALGDDRAFELNQFVCTSSKVHAVNASGKLSLLQSAMAIKKSAIAVGVDTSLAHMACAVGKQNVIVMGGGHFGRFMPYSPLTSLVCLPLNCYGCNWYCRHERVHCVQDIHPDTIHKALIDSFGQTSAKPRIYLQQRLLDTVVAQYQAPDSFVDHEVEYISY